MKKLTLLIFAALMAVVASGSSSRAARGKSDEGSQPRAAVTVSADKDRVQIVETIHQFNAAAIRNDVDTMGRMLADEYSTTNGYGSVAGKADVLRAQRNRTMQYSSVTLHDVEVQVNGDFAVEKDISDVKGTWHGRPFSGSFASTRTLQKRNGEWKMLAFEVHDQK